jgi:RNA polymerase sigma-70 factor, ECF subfamily
MTMAPDELALVLLRERLRVTAVAGAIVRDIHTADDIFQQVVLRALEQPGQFNDDHHVLAWAMRAARHRALDAVGRARALSLPDDVLDLLEAEWGDPADPAWSDRVEALQRCVGQLAGPVRDLLRMKYRDGLTAPAIAGETRRTPEAVYQTLSRAHRSLRGCVERELLRLKGAVEGGVS